MAKYKHYKFKEVIDWQGEAWDVYEEYRSPSGIMIYRGWPYGLTPKDGICGIFSYIFTPEIAEFIKTHSITESEQQLALSTSMVGKFRRWLGITQKRIHRNDAWILEHQDEILYDSLETLKNKYGLTKSRVYLHRKWLAELIELDTKAKLRRTVTDEHREQWYQHNKMELASLSIEEIAARYQISIYVAKKYYNRVRKEQKKPTYSEQVQQHKKNKQQWLLEHQHQILDSQRTVAEIAQDLNRTEGQILRARAKLRELHQTPKVKDQLHAWLLEHQEDLLNRNLNCHHLAKKLNMSPKQVSVRRSQLRELLQLPTYAEKLQQWRLDNKDILLSMDLSVDEIAKRLNRSYRAVVKDRDILRKTLNISVKDQKMAWVMERKTDFETLSIPELAEKYQLGKFALLNYKKLLHEMKQNKSVTKL